MQQYTIWRMQSSFYNYLRSKKRIENIKLKFDSVTNEKYELIKQNTELSSKLQDNEEKRCII